MDNDSERMGKMLPLNPLHPQEAYQIHEECDNKGNPGALWIHFISPKLKLSDHSTETSS